MKGLWQRMDESHSPSAITIESVTDALRHLYTIQSEREILIQTGYEGAQLFNDALKRHARIDNLRRTLHELYQNGRIDGKAYNTYTVMLGSPDPDTVDLLEGLLDVLS